MPGALIKKMSASPGGTIEIRALGNVNELVPTRVGLLITTAGCTFTFRGVPIDSLF